MKRHIEGVEEMTVKKYDFSQANTVLQNCVDNHVLAGVSSAVIVDGVVVDSFCAGMADMQSGEALRADHIHRGYSTTKIMTSVLVLLLIDQGHFALDDAIKNWIPSFGKVRVLRRGATVIDDTESLQADITIRQLLSHQAGLSHGVFDMGTMIFNAYHAAGVRKSDTNLETLMDQLATLPLTYQPGQGWEYSMAPDVLGRLVEIVTGKPLADAFKTMLFDPLGMVDTAFVLRADQAPRLTVLYAGDARQPTKPGLKRLDNMPWPDAFLKPVPRQAGSSGLVTTQLDMLALMKQLIPGYGTLLKPATLTEMMRDQLPVERCVQIANIGVFASLGFGLGGTVTRASSELQPNTPVGEFQWGGLAGTHWWVSPRTGAAGVLMTQRHWGFWNPFWFDYKKKMYAALLR
jgi:CubicO group peptidase (beta-lactamase class C family)